MWVLRTKNLEYNKAVEIKAVLTDIINIVNKASPNKKVEDIESALTAYLSSEWNSRSTTGITAAIGFISSNDQYLFSKADQNKILKALDKAYRTLEKTIATRVKKDTKRVYNILKLESGKQLRKKGIKKQDEDEDAPFKDPYVISNLARIRNVSIGTHFERTLRPQISKIIEEAVLDKGLNKKQAGEFLKSELTRKLGGSAFRDAIPESVFEAGKKSVDNYFEGLSDTHMTMSKSFAQIVAMNEVQIRQVQFFAVIDDRTSIICLEMDGRIWDIEVVNTVMVEMLESKDVDELKERAPWKRDLSEFNVTRGERQNDPILAGDLAKAGVVIPPLHFRCRSELQPL